MFNASQCPYEADNYSIPPQRFPSNGYHSYMYFRNLGPVVQSIVSLTISLRHKFVKQISAKVTNTLLFSVEKM